LRRNGYQQRNAGKNEGRLSIDEGGHLIASSLGGPGEGINLVAMDTAQNQAVDTGVFGSAGG
ncbi:MAG: DNA/RNA non-specific endonuclease, partial [Janthinobacterium lividum]